MFLTNMKTFTCAQFVVLFLYGFLGVHSNSLQFRTYPTQFVRYTPYNPRVINKVCYLKPESGPCRANIEMYYFSPESGNCTTFKWGGCQGNGNRFNTLTECTDYCLSPPNEDRTRPKYCSHAFDYGFCFGGVNRYYFDFKWKICKKALYSGCGGNRNNFESLTSCEQECRLGRYRTKATTLSDRLHKHLVVNAIHATTRKSRIQLTTKFNVTEGTTLQPF